MDKKAIAEARSNLSDLIAQVRIARRMVLLCRRGKPQAALVPAELGEAAEAVGGPDVAVQILQKSLGR
jgi:prevent-host-death family protein